MQQFVKCGITFTMEIEYPTNGAIPYYYGLYNGIPFDIEEYPCIRELFVSEFGYVEDLRYTSDFD